MATESPLRHIRCKVFGVSQEEMAAIAGVSRPMISKYETGENAPPMDVLARIRAAARMVSPDFSADAFFEVPAAIQ